MTLQKILIPNLHDHLVNQWLNKVSLTMSNNRYSAKLKQKRKMPSIHLLIKFQNQVAKRRAILKLIKTIFQKFHLKQKILSRSWSKPKKLNKWSQERRTNHQMIQMEISVWASAIQSAQSPKNDLLIMNSFIYFQWISKYKI